MGDAADAVDQLVAVTSPPLRPLLDKAVHGDPEERVRAAAAVAEIERLKAFVGPSEKFRELGEDEKAELTGRLRRFAFLRTALEGAYDHAQASCQEMQDPELMAKLRWCSGRVLGHYRATADAIRIIAKAKRR